MRRFQLVLKKRSIIVALNDDKWARLSGTRSLNFEKREQKEYPISSPFLSDAKKVTVLLEQWVKDQIIRLLYIDYLPSTKDQKTTNYCLYH